MELQDTSRSEISFDLSTSIETEPVVVTSLNMPTEAALIVSAPTGAALAVLITSTAVGLNVPAAPNMGMLTALLIADPAALTVGRLTDLPVAELKELTVCGLTVLDAQNVG